MTSLSAMQSLADLHAKFNLENMFPFDAESLLGFGKGALDATSRDATAPRLASTATRDAALAAAIDFMPQLAAVGGFEAEEPAIAKVIDYRGERVAAFDLHGKEMICLPQVYELFLKNMVGGLHTVYTKLKRLEINPLICNVEQVRALRSLGAIQPGVNRCKLIETADFDRLLEDCSNASTRPGRPPKRVGPFEEWSQIKRDRFDLLETTTDHNVFPAMAGAPSVTPTGMGAGILPTSPIGSSSQLQNSLLFGQFLPQFNAHQLLMRHMMSMATASGGVQKPLGKDQTLGLLNMGASDDIDYDLNEPQSSNGSDSVAIDMTKNNTERTVSGSVSTTTESANNNNNNNNSETSDSDSLENMRNDKLSESPSDMGGSSSRSNNSSSRSGSSDEKSAQFAAVNKIISLIDMATDHFNQQKEELQREKDRLEEMRMRLPVATNSEDDLRQQLEAEKKKSTIYFRRYCKSRREVLELKEKMLELRTSSAVTVVGSSAATTTAVTEVAETVPNGSPSPAPQE